MFDTVQNELHKGKCLGIFPEGGSHDRTDLLPLKVGVAAIAFGVLDKYDMNVPIVPVGLNYFRGHRFRGRVVVEYGEPIFIDKDTIEIYKSSKRQGYQTLLAKVEEGMRSVIVTAPDYSELKLIHTARRLYQKSPSAMSKNPTKYRQDLARRFSVGYQLLKDRFGGEQDLPAEIMELKRQIIEYQDTLDHWGLFDYQVTKLDAPFKDLLYTFLHALVMMLVAAVPTIFLNAPVGLAASYWSRNEAKKEAESSRVKLAARDIIMSKKIVFSLVAVPVLWVLYAVLLCLFTKLEFKTIVVIILSCPLLSYAGVTGLGMGMIDMKNLRPAFLRLFPQFQVVMKTLPVTRANLQKEIRKMIKKYASTLGGIYYDKSDKWEKKLIWKNSNHSSGMLNALAEESGKKEVEEVRNEENMKTSEEETAGSNNINDNDFYFTTGVSASLPVDDDVQVMDQNAPTITTNAVSEEVEQETDEAVPSLADKKVN